MRDDHDGPGTLYHLVSGRAVDSHDILAPRTGAKPVKERRGPKVDEQHECRKQKARATQRKLGCAVHEARHEQATEQQAAQDVRHVHAPRVGVELLNGGFQVVVSEYVRYDVGGHKLLLAIGWGNRDVLIEIVHVFARIGHCALPPLIAA